MVEKMMEELQNPQFWMAVAFCCIFVLAIRPLKNKLSVWGQEQAKTIQKELDEAAFLRKQAEDLYTEYEEHTKNLDKERAQILRSAEKEVIIIQQEADEKLSNHLDYRKKDVQSKIQSIQENATKDITQQLLQQVMNQTKELLTENPIRQTEKDMDDALDKVFKILEKQTSAS